MSLASKQHAFLNSQAPSKPIIQIRKNGLNDQIKTSVHVKHLTLVVVKVTLLQNTDEILEEEIGVDTVQKNRTHLDFV